jgi:hypothetical protein
MEIARRGVAKMLIPKYNIFLIKESVLENAKIMYEWKYGNKNKS